jgi:hypothetical protein
MKRLRKSWRVLWCSVVGVIFLLFGMSACNRRPEQQGPAEPTAGTISFTGDQLADDAATQSDADDADVSPQVIPNRVLMGRMLPPDAAD